MDFDKVEYSIGDLAKAYKSGSLSRNEEYQRGAAWSQKQKQGLIDSVFRDYPLPSLFLETKVSSGLGGEQTRKYEIIDGQQRILALVEYLDDHYPTLDPHDSKLRLPLSLRARGAPWAKKLFSELDTGLQTKLDTYKVPVYLVREVENSDEVRDLFIRLQSGTALTRQQIRDAWPGQLGPKIEQWAGKLTKSPKYKFFEAVDGRGTRDEEDDASDLYVKSRTTCAQLCTLLIARQGNPWAFPSIKAADLDALYHENTQRVDDGLFSALSSIFSDIEDVVQRIPKGKGKKKIPKGALLALAMHIQDMHRSPLFKLTWEAKQQLADALVGESVQNMRGSSGGVIQEYYESWRNRFPEGVGVNLDPKRLFDENDKAEIFKRANGLCAVCGKGVTDDAEYDHFPAPFRDGGRTVPNNGRLVHRDCHPRGRPAES